ncbi:alpha/beta fold hydrolase [Bradyrhizobium sp. sGM-13]|uniref:alpha/beta fold hydrolase n=1 Tax=Bradyrhizobium sp. sGM-13 TaxID=2831781 RepID=UPI0035C799F4
MAYSRRNHFPNEASPEGMPDGAADAHGEDLAAFVRALGLSKVRIVAHSSGAHAALFFVLCRRASGNGGQPDAQRTARDGHPGRRSRRRRHVERVGQCPGAGEGGSQGRRRENRHTAVRECCRRTGRI